MRSTSIDHAWNTLSVPGEADRFKLVDPDGYFMEPAYDMGISMREWIDEYLSGDAVKIGRARAVHLSELSGQPESAIPSDLARSDQAAHFAKPHLYHFTAWHRHFMLGEPLFRP